MKKTADLLTYPLPFKGKFGIKELFDSAVGRANIVGVIGHTDFDDNPDQRFKQFWEDTKNLHSDFEVIPYFWGNGKQRNVLTAFTVAELLISKDRDQERAEKLLGLTKEESLDDKGIKVTFLYGVNDPVEHEGKIFNLLRIGIDFNEKPHKPGENLEKVVNEASEQGALILAPPETYGALKKSTKDMILCLKIDGIYWDAQRIFGRRRKQEKIIENAEGEYPIVAVSNAHMAYFKEPTGDFMEEIGRSSIELEEFKWKTGKELVGKIKRNIRKGEYSSRKEYSPITSILNWGIRMKARKLMKKVFKTDKYDYRWPEGDPLVRFPKDSYLPED
jgi:hypothetical protein